MKVQIGKWGNSLAVRLPRDLVERFDLKEGGEIDMADVERGLEVGRDEERERRRRQALKEIAETRLTLPDDWKFDREGGELAAGDGPLVTLDTNVAIYAFTDREPKAAAALDVLARTSFVSVQLLNEFANVLLRKRRLPWEQVNVLRAKLYDAVQVVLPLTEPVHQQGMRLAERYCLSVYDASMLSVALSAGATTFYSEDMQSGLIIDDVLTIIDPFQGTAARMTQFDLTDEQREIQELARRFTADTLTPNAAHWDEHGIFPKAEIKASAALGFGAIYVSEESGGIGLGRLEAALIMEAMAYGDPATSAFISIHNMAAWMIDRFGSVTVKAKYLPDLVSMERIASYALTEPGSGSDAAALRTTAVRDGDHYVLNGTKQFISGAGENDVYVAMVRTGEPGPKGVTAMVIERDMPGVSFGAKERKLGWNASPTASLILEDVRVPVENLVGAEGEGFRIAMMGLDGGRLNIGACSLGGGQRCLDEAIAYTKERQQFGKPIADFQNTQFTLADMATDLEAARALLYLAAAKVTANAPDKTRFSAMAKRLATDTGSKVANDALQLFGGYGYLKDYPIERFWRDLRVHSILEGTNQIMRMIVGRELVRQ